MRNSSQSKALMHYAVLDQPGTPYGPRNLPLRTHKEWIIDAIYVEEGLAQSHAEYTRRSTANGVAGLPLFAQISSLRFPTCNPHDRMHFLENILPMLVNLWTGNYKDLDAGCENYQWDEPGKKTVLNAIRKHHPQLLWPSRSKSVHSARRIHGRGVDYFCHDALSRSSSQSLQEACLLLTFHGAHPAREYVHAIWA